MDIGTAIFIGKATLQVIGAVRTGVSVYKKCSYIYRYNPFHNSDKKPEPIIYELTSADSFTVVEETPRTKTSNPNFEKKKR